MTEEKTSVDWLADSAISYMKKTGGDVDEHDLEDWLRADIEHHDVPSADVDGMIEDGRLMIETLRTHFPRAFVSPSQVEAESR